MNSCSTCGTYAKTFDLGNQQADLGPKRRHDGKLEFVEHILGTLIESRYGYENPYVRLGEPASMTGHSQMFANVRLLTAVEIAAHLELPLASANGSWSIDRTGFSPTAVWAKAREILERLTRRLKPTAIPSDHASSPFFHQPTNLARGSPTF
ncbi:MAG: hypothetical protein ABL959_20950, partial [Pyrinomonadaceae bacterium]